MTVREELFQEIEQASDDVLEVLVSVLRQMRLSQLDRSALMELAAHSSAELPVQKHYPLRGMPVVIADDFDAPMSDLWDALGR
ncbi:hypothetical protein NG798_13200 [Ancylothrix sp. C2]|uniref:hypothetical protein n=1 Tax=Ancylothrix sp. D3o TaxID=2953691 RepID=UPI0021BB6348|nr:hypothetical protein [Ancylothrix sp. D3o]MCT7950752.1 hypothetical protein [Ancylothrix sp. D3o]